jgi:hypothetical protein
MLSQYVQAIEGMGVLGTVSLVISILVFLGIVVWAFRADPSYVRTMEHLPLDAAADSDANAAGRNRS